MNYTLKRLILLFIMMSLINVAGCAEVSKKVEYYWEKIKYEFSDKQTGTRENAVQKYKEKVGQEKLIIEQPVITPNTASPGQKIKQKLQYAIICPQEDRKISVSEILSISTGKDKIELAKKESVKAQGIYESIIEIIIPQDLYAGEYKLITTVTAGEQKKTVSGSFLVKR